MQTNEISHIQCSFTETLISDGPLTLTTQRQLFHINKQPNSKLSCECFQYRKFTSQQDNFYKNMFFFFFSSQICQKLACKQQNAFLLLMVFLMFFFPQLIFCVIAHYLYQRTLASPETAIRMTCGHLSGRALREIFSENSLQCDQTLVQFTAGGEASD